MDTILSLILNSVEQTALSLWHNWPYLLVSVLVAAALKLFLNPERISIFLKRYRNVGILAATTAAVATPLCSCGTTAVVLGMMASLMPWAPIIAFMVASPLTSPGELVYSAGLFGWPFAVAFFAASIVLGLAGGLAGAFLESRGWLKNQARLGAACTNCAPTQSVEPAGCRCSEASTPGGALAAVAPPKFILQFGGMQGGQHGSENNFARDSSVACGICAPLPAVEPATCGCSVTSAPGGVLAAAPLETPPSLKEYANATFQSGKQLLVMFLGFAFIGFFLNGLIPSAWITAIFGSGHIYGVPLAATLGLPFYINTEASLPLIRAMLDTGMSQGAAMAFMISGAGTSIGAVVGALTIARWRVISIVVGMLWIGAIAFGYLFDFMLKTGLIR